MKILNFGSLNIDYVYNVENFVKPGETISSKGLSVFCGGKGLNQSIAIAKAGCDVFHAGKIGIDGEILKAELEKAKVNTTYLLQGEGRSGHAIIQVSNKGQNSILLFGGENETITNKEIDRVLEGFSKGDLLLIQCEINNLDYIVNSAYEKGMGIILNPSPINQHLKSIDISKISYLILNEVEGAELSGKENHYEILNELMERYNHLKIVLTLGEKGVVYAEGDKRVYQKIFETQVIDTTAAGDTFTGYFIAGLVKKWEVEEILKTASKASSIAVSRNGAAPSIPYMAEVIESL